MADPNERRLNQLESQQERLISQLKRSSTAGAGSQMASYADMAAQQKLLRVRDQIENIKNKRLIERWYGDLPQKEKPTGGQRGSLGNFFDALQRPLYGVVGATEYLLGNKKKDPNIFKAVNKNIKERKRTFADVLKDTGAKGIISMPIGFMLDLAMDPVNWATMGTSALVPRVAYGFTKGAATGGLRTGIKAASAGAKSSVLGGVMMARNIPKAISFSRMPKKSFVKNTSRFSNLMNKLENASIKSSADYQMLTGVDPIKRLGNAGVPLLESKWRVNLGELIREAASRREWTKNLFNSLDYDNASWTELVRIQDAIENLSKQHPIEKQSNEAIEKYTTQLKTLLKKNEEKIRRDPIDWDSIKNSDDIDFVHKKIEEYIGKDEKLRLEKEFQDSMDIIFNRPEKYVTLDGVENTARLAEEKSNDDFFKELNKAIEAFDSMTGVRWYDKLLYNAKNIEKQIKIGKKSVVVGDAIKKALDGYGAFIALFKRSKVGASLSAWTNAILGNPVIAELSGVNIFDPLYFSRVRDAKNIITGGKASRYLLGELISTRGVMDDIIENPTLTESTLGLSPDFIKAKYLLESLVQAGKESGVIKRGDDVASIKKAIDEELNVIQKEVGINLNDVVKDAKSIFAVGKKVKPHRGPGGKLVDNIPASEGLSAPTHSDIYRRRLIESGGELDSTKMPTGYGIEFVESPIANKIFDRISKRAKEGHIGAQLLDISFNRIPDAYQRIDQAYKMGLTMYATMDGLTEKELRAISRIIKIQPEDLVKTTKGGVVRYKMGMAKALELANEVYLNYAAMPAAIKMIRTIPILGSPFISFMYGMLIKTGKALAYNPSSFNKVNLFVHDFSGQKSPLEKAVLQDPRYSYLNEPGMMKVPGISELPFFKKYSIYLNTANMIPFYSLNMFNPSERRYDDLYSNTVVQAIDKSPILKDPVGSLIFDYFIQPMILSKHVRPLGSFGQPLYPKDATALEKAGYMTRSLAETVTPSVWAPVFGTIQGAVAPELTPLAPSYRWRQLSNAMRGKNPVGIKGREPALSRTLRSYAGILGLPIQAPLPNTYIPKDIKNKLKKYK